MKQYIKQICTLSAALILVFSLVACQMKASNEDTSSTVIETYSSQTSTAGSTAKSESSSSKNENSQTESTAQKSESSTSQSESSSSGDEASDSSVIVPEGFTERDFDLGYSDYVTVVLNGTSASADGSGVVTGDGVITITEDGTYLLTGTYEGQILIDVSDEDGKVQLVLDSAVITCEDSAGIYVKSADKVFITTTAGSVNEVSTTVSFVQSDDNTVDGAIFSKGNLVLNGEGTLKVYSAEGHGIVSKDDLKITSGTYVIDAAEKGMESNDMIGIAGGIITIDSGDDGMNTDGYIVIENGTIEIDSGDDAIHADTILTINGGSMSLDAHEGLEATVININDGMIVINASDDGINAAQKVDDYTPMIEINGGEITVNMAAGDTDGLDSNGYIFINGGTVSVNAQFPFDYDLGAELNGGTVYVNGEQVTQLSNQFGGMGGGPGQGGFPGGGQGGQGGGHGR
ncbi:MAG: carbohydrate-binding domain-containing protein [Firmicutes bacterium]|nr:carbohydrate-binding domain-containing protein [Bacillota bacterium]